MLRVILFAFSVFFSLTCYSQKSSSRINAGIEQDLLPYGTGGYFAGLWAGKNHIRGRALIARVHKPDFITKKGFTNNNVTAYALLADYFLKENWKGWWAGSGIVYWKSSIQSDKKANVYNYENWLLNGSIGYNYKIYKNFYVSPWAGMSIRAAGDKSVIVEDKTFTPPLLNPEISVKLGIYL